MIMQDNEKKPALRFKGFTDPWEQRKLGDITVELSEYATQELGLPLLTSSRSGLMYQDEYRDSRTTKSTETLFSVVPVGTCTYRHMSDDDVFHMNINTLEKGLVSREYPVFEASKGNNLEFLVQHINSSEEFKAFCAEQKKGGTRTRLYYNTLCQFTVRVPALKEQAQISQCLKKLDTLITLHQRKYEKLVNIKKSMLDKMFPQNGASVPEIRFKGFTDPWEQRKLGDISEIKTGPFGSTLHADDYVSDGIPIITTEHFKTGSLPTDKCGLPQVSENDFSRLSAYILNAGDIVFSRVGSVDINALITPFQSTWLFSGRVLRVRPQNKNSSQFLHTLLETEDVKNDIRTRAVGQTMPSINTEILKTTPLRLPESTLEQEQLGKYFLNLDTLITLHQRKLEKLQNIKKSCLEKMFV